MPGIFFYVVGASGVGKDTLIAGAMAVLGPSGRFVQARRVITRPAGPGEDHEPVSPEEFDRRESAEKFLLTWEAHGLRYGLPASLHDVLADGRHVIANGSRAATARLVGRVARLMLVEITAPARALRARILQRGRETEAETAARLTRDVPSLPAGLPHAVVANDTDIADGIARLVAVLTAAAEGEMLACPG